MKTKSELMNEEKRKKAESIIEGISEEKKTSKTTTVILNEETKKQFQEMIKKNHVSLSGIFEIFMRCYIKNPEIRKIIIEEMMSEEK